MAKKMDTSRVKKYFDVERLYGNSYSYIGLNIDGPDETINKKIKDMQEKEFKEVAEARLFNQKERYRYKILQGRRFRSKKEEEEKEYERSETIEEEFANFQISDFMDLTYTEEELSDIIIDIQMADIEEANTKKERCCAWVLNHCK